MGSGADNKNDIKTGYFPMPLVIECQMASESDFRYKVYYNPFIYTTRAGERISVPVGFPTDFASVPWVMRRLIPKAGRWNEAAVIHDYLTTLSNEGKYDRKKADYIFAECMEVLGVKGWRIKAMYAGVATYTALFKGTHGKQQKGKRRKRTF